MVNPSTNRFTSPSFSYDKNGNVTKDIDPVTNQPRQTTFNGDNKQTEVKDTNGTSIGKYYYDGEGKRVKKVTATATTIFVYSGGKLVAEYSTQISQNPTISYTTTDHLGSPRVITDKTGNVNSRRDFMPFGEDIFAGIGGRTGDTSQRYSSSTDDIRQKFTGYQKDKESSLDFAEARMYENRYGRFTAVDPLIASGKSANPQSFNRYVYVGSNPLRRIDPSGEDWWDVTDKAGTRHITWFDEDPDEELFDINGRWEKYLYRASDSQWYALNPDGPESQGFSEYERAYWQYGNYVNFDGAYEGFVYDMFSANDMAHMVAGMKTGNVEDSIYYFGKISVENGVGAGLGKFICGRSGATSTLGLNTSEAVARNTITSMVPVAARSLGKWGEARLAQVLGNAGERPAKAMYTSLGKRFVDRTVNGVAHEAKAGLNVGLTSTIKKQILKDAELIMEKQINGAHWHFFRGAKQEVLDFLTQNGIKYTVY